MAARSRSRPSARTVALGDDLRIAHARATFETLAGAAQDGVVEIAGAQVTRVDAAGLQALAAAIARLRAAGVSCRWEKPSEALVAAARVAGLEGALELAG